METQLQEVQEMPYQFPTKEVQLECAGLGMSAAVACIIGMIILNFARRALNAGNASYD